MFDKYIDFNPLNLELMRFSKYLVFDEEKEGISCPIAIQKLQKEKYKDEEGRKKKYVIAFIISGAKVIKTIKEKLDKFDIELFNTYIYDKKNLRVVVYLFDTRIQKENIAFKQFLGKVSSVNSIFLNINKFVIEHVFSLVALISIIFTALLTHFVYSGLVAYGVVPQLVTGIHEITFLLSFSLLFIVALVFLIYVFVPIVLPFVLVFSLVGYFKFGLSMSAIFGLTILLVIILFVSLYIIMKFKPLRTDNFFNEIKNFISIISVVAAFIVFLLVILLIGSTTILGTMTHDFSKHLRKSNYGMVIDIYQNMYSGYPKILIDKKDANKTYYVPFESNGYYYAYDINSVREAYFEKLKKDDKEFVIKVCSDNQEKQEFMKSYIIDNPYIKVLHQNNLRFKIDSNQTEIDPKKSEPLYIKSFLITKKDINKKLCDGKIVK